MLLLGNIASFIGCMIMVCLGLVKKKDHIMAAQCVQFAFLGLGNLALGAGAGFISNMVSILRNLVFAKVKNTTALKLLFIAVQATLTLVIGGTAWIEWLPVTAVVIYTWFLDTKSDMAFKCLIFGTQLLWLVYDFYYKNYVSFTFDILTLVSTAIGMLRIKKANAEG